MFRSRCDMRAKQPPQIGTLLLKRLGALDDALVGDIVEEWNRGRSAVWFWRQVIVAITSTVTTTIRENRLLSARAIIAGWAVLWMFHRFPGRRINSFMSG